MGHTGKRFVSVKNRLVAGVLLNQKRFTRSVCKGPERFKLLAGVGEDGQATACSPKTAHTSFCFELKRPCACANMAFGTSAQRLQSAF